MRRLAVLPCLLLLLFSCSTFTASEGPAWTEEPPRYAGIVSIVGSGTGRDENEARAAAYRSVLDRVSSDLGIDAFSLYYRELLTTGTIADLSGRVTNTYLSPSADGVAFYVLVEMPEDEYYRRRSDEYTASLERASTVDGYMAAALEEYKANRDTKTLENVLSALDLALSGSLADSAYTAEGLRDSAQAYLENIAISIGKRDGMEVELRMKRDKGLFHPSVVNGLIKAEYQKLTSDGRIVTSSVTLMTDRAGRVRFVPTDPYMLRKGVLRFSIAIPEDLISSIEEKAPDGFMDPIIALIGSSSIEYAYDAGEKAVDTVIAAAVYGEDGTVYDSPSYNLAFSSYLRSASASGFVAIQGSGEEEEEILGSLRAAFPGMRRYIVIRTGIVDSDSGAGREYVLTESQASIYEGYDDSPSEILHGAAAGGGATADEAGRAALESNARYMAGMLLSRL